MVFGNVLGQSRGTLRRLVILLSALESRTIPLLKKLELINLRLLIKVGFPRNATGRLLPHGIFANLGKLSFRSTSSENLLLGDCVLFEVVGVEVELEVDVVLRLKLTDQASYFVPLASLFLRRLLSPLWVVLELQEDLKDFLGFLLYLVHLLDPVH